MRFYAAGWPGDRAADLVELYALYSTGSTRLKRETHGGGENTE